MNHSNYLVVLLRCEGLFSDFLQQTQANKDVKREDLFIVSKVQTISLWSSFTLEKTHSAPGFGPF